MYSLIWSWQYGWSSINRSITNTSYKFDLAASELTARDINLYDDRIQFNHRPRAANSFWTPSREPTDWSLAHIAVIVMFLLSINVNNSEYISMILLSVGILLQSFSVSHCQDKPRSSTIPSINSIFKIFLVSNSTYRSLEYAGRAFSSTLENTTLATYPTNSICFLKALNLYRHFKD